MLTEPDAGDSFTGACAVCGVEGRFTRDGLAVRESYPCGACGARLRYQGQARVIVDRFARHGSTSLAALYREPELRELRIWEPGQLGPLRDQLRSLPGFESSSYWPDVAPGERRDGVRCEDLMALSFPSESFDLVITSDIFEHVRRPLVGFAEVHRVLRPGGVHVFTVPGLRPVRLATRERVDVSGDDDVLLMEAAFHGPHLVYNNFGLDLLERLAAIGFQTDLVRFASDHPEASRLVTYCSVKAAIGG